MKLIIACANIKLCITYIGLVSDIHCMYCTKYMSSINLTITHSIMQYNNLLYIRTNFSCDMMWWLNWYDDDMQTCVCARAHTHTHAHAHTFVEMCSNCLKSSNCKTWTLFATCGACNVEGCYGLSAIIFLYCMIQCVYYEHMCDNLISSLNWCCICHFQRGPVSPDWASD
jgi:hypothetical protein